MGQIKFGFSGEENSMCTSSGCESKTLLELNFSAKET